MRKFLCLLTIAIQPLCLCTETMSLSSNTDSITVLKNIEDTLREFKSKDFDTIDFDSGSLKIHAFDVGQANFIVMKRGNEAVIIDAGIQHNYFVPINNIDAVLSATTVKAVFITHPHTDHFSLIKKLLNDYARGFEDTTFLLGGKKTDWNNDGNSKRKKVYDTLKKRGKNFLFLDDIAPDSPIFISGCNFIDGVNFKVFDLHHWDYIKVAKKTNLAH